MLSLKINKINRLTRKKRNKKNILKSRNKNKSKKGGSNTIVLSSNIRKTQPKQLNLVLRNKKTNQTLLKYIVLTLFINEKINTIPNKIAKNYYKQFEGGIKVNLNNLRSKRLKALKNGRYSTKKLKGGSSVVQAVVRFKKSFVCKPITDRSLTPNNNNFISELDFNNFSLEEKVNFLMSNCNTYDDYLDSLKYMPYVPDLKRFVDDSLNDTLLSEYPEMPTEFPENILFSLGFNYGKMICDLIQIHSELNIIHSKKTRPDCTNDFFEIISINKFKLNKLYNSIGYVFGNDLRKINIRKLISLFRHSQGAYLEPTNNFIINFLNDTSETVFNSIIIDEEFYTINVKPIVNYEVFEITINPKGSPNDVYSKSTWWRDLNSKSCFETSKIKYILNVNNIETLFPSSLLDSSLKGGASQTDCSIKLIKNPLENLNDKILNTHCVFDGTHDFDHHLSDFTINDYLPGNKDEAKKIYNANHVTEAVFLHHTIYGRKGFLYENKSPPIHDIQIFLSPDTMSAEEGDILNDLTMAFDQGGHISTDPKKKQKTPSFAKLYTLDGKRVRPKLSMMTDVWDAGGGAKLSEFDTIKSKTHPREFCNIHNLVACYVFWKYWFINFNVKKYIQKDVDKYPLILINPSDGLLYFAYVKFDSKSVVLGSDEQPLLFPKPEFNSDFYSIKFNGKNVFTPGLHESKFFSDFDKFFLKSENFKIILTDILFPTKNNEGPGVNLLMTVIKKIISYMNVNCSKNSLSYTGGKGRGNGSNSIKNKNIVLIEYLNKLYGDINYENISKGYQKLITCYMFKHSGDTSQSYLDEICNTFTYTEDGMLICNNLLNNKRLVTCNQIQTTKNEAKIWPIVKTQKSAFYDIFAQLKDKKGYFTLCYNIQQIPFSKYMESNPSLHDLSDIETVKIPINIKGVLKEIRLNSILSKYYALKVVKDPREQIPAFNFASANGDIDTYDEILKNKIKDLIRVSDQYEIFQNIEIKLNLPQSILDEDQFHKPTNYVSISKSKLSDQIKILGFVDTDLTNISIYQYLIYCVNDYNIMIGRGTSVDIIFNKHLQLHFFGYLEKILQIFETQIRISSNDGINILVDKHLNKCYTTPIKKKNKFVLDIQKLNENLLNNFTPQEGKYNKSLLPIKFFYKNIHLFNVTSPKITMLRTKLKGFEFNILNRYIEELNIIKSKVDGMRSILYILKKNNLDLEFIDPITGIDIDITKSNPILLDTHNQFSGIKQLLYTYPFTSDEVEDC